MEADKTRRHILGVVLVLLAAGIVSAAVVAGRTGRPGDDDQAARSARTTVDHYAVADVAVAPGGDVVFRNDDNEPHTYTAETGLFDSGLVAPGGTFRWAAGNPRVVQYRCELHAGERGTIVVGGGG